MKSEKNANINYLSTATPTICKKSATTASRKTETIESKLPSTSEDIENMTKDKVLIEKFKGFDIYFDKYNERFIADKPKLDIHFQSRSLWEIKGCIKQSQTKEVNKEYLIKSGYSNDRIAKILLMTTNKTLNDSKYKILQDTGNGYDIGRIESNNSPILYPLTDENLKLYDLVLHWEKKKKEIENRQKNLVGQLKK